MTLKLKLIIALAFMAGEFTAYVIASSPWSPIAKAEAAVALPKTMLVSDCAMLRTPEFIQFEQIVASMGVHRSRPQRVSTPHLPKPETRAPMTPRPKPRSAADDEVAALIARLD